MIRAFFGLTCFPFKKDISKIFLSRQLNYLKKRTSHFLETQGIALLTGEIGSGKTTFMRWFLNNSINPNTYRFIYISQTARTARSFFRTVAKELRLLPKFIIEDVSAQVKTGLLDIFRKHKLKPILIIDEAQNLSDSVLEEIRLLTNFRMDSKNYLSIFLLGPPVLKGRLKLNPYAALKQRISFFYHLTGIEQDEIQPYLSHRLKLAGKKDSLFSDKAVTLLFNYSRGLPRVINTMAHEALYQAALQKKNMIDDSLIENIIREWDNL